MGVCFGRRLREEEYKNKEQEGHGIRKGTMTERAGGLPYHPQIQLFIDAGTPGGRAHAGWSPSPAPPHLRIGFGGDP